MSFRFLWETPGLAPPDPRRRRCESSDKPSFIPCLQAPREGPPDGSYQSYRSPGFEIWKLSDPARPPMRAPSRHMSASAAFLGAAPCFFNDVDGHTYHAMPCRADLHGPSQTHDMTTMVAFESACNLFLRTNAQHDLASPRARITCTRQAMNRGWIGCAQRGLANLLTA
ncbi:hypothetical protein B0J15DRAFT_241074 [Fusarium solani]|jgi:hypothetical protein|uniref:Uncharacterized protein n=1 Tax=Fusarium solani TaxID=169388 RepID=A0A9P9HYJ0_FUSSL|nr:uncharacterized protein B0J15DRAFT_241074 [Fusarium solani]KAH7266209.1 hypothetical protein B0J15DRAFT_241074 [Fusarium solani]